MANKIVKTRIRHKYDTEANWTSKNPVLFQGEIAISSDKNGQFKTGDGTLKWSQIAYNQVPWTSVVGRPSTMNPTTTALNNQDLDTIKTPGLYNGEGGNAVLNKPNGSDAFGLFVYKTASGFITQELTEGNKSVSKKWIRQYNGSSWTSWGYFYSTLHPQQNISGNAATASVATKLGTSTIGGTAKPMYLNAGVPTAFSSTIGASTKPIFMNAGTLTAFSATVGASTKPIFMNAGTLTASSSTVGSATIPIYMNSGTITACTSLSLNTTGSAARWATPRTLTLIGSVTGSVNIDGSGNVSMTTTTNHTHSYLPLSGGILTNNVSYNMHSSTQIPLKVYGGNGDGQGISLGAGGATIVGSGESAKACESLLSATTEQLWLASDNEIMFFTGCQTIANKVGVILNAARSFYPNVNNTGTLGTASYKWNNVYATTFTGNLSGTATKATQDGSGNTITSKYVAVDTTQNISGVKTFTNTTASTSKSTGALKVAGGIGVAGQMSANKVMIGDHCTLEYSSDGSLDFVFS